MSQGFVPTATIRPCNLMWVCFFFSH